MPKITATNSLIKERKSKLLKKYKIDIEGDIPLSLYPRVVGDFLAVKYPKKNLLKVVSSAKSALKVVQVFADIPQPRVELLDLFETSPDLCGQDCIQTLKEKLMKQMALDSALKASMRTVFKNLYTQIGGFIVNKSEALESIKNVNQILKFQELRFINYNLNPNKSSKRAQLALDLETMDPTVDYTEILSQTAFSNFFARADLYPTHPTSSLEYLKDQVLAFLASKPEDRKETLKAALLDQGIQLRSDSTFCNQYIGKQVCCELEEVVATMGLTKAMFAYSHIAWSNNRHEYEAELKRLFFNENLSWKDALSRIENSDDFKSTCANSHRIVHHYEDYDDDDDEEDSDDYWGGGGRRRYGRGGACWNCGDYGHYARDCFF